MSSFLSGKMPRRPQTDNYRYWSEDELLRLHELCQSHSSPECAEILGRTLKSVKQAALVRGFSFQKNLRRSFSTYEDNYIRKSVGRLSLRSIADDLGRTHSSIKARARRLGLSGMYVPIRNIIHSDEDVELCRQLAEAGLALPEIAEKMEIPLPTVKDYVNYKIRYSFLPDFIYDIRDRT